MKIFDGMQNFFNSLGEYVKNFSNLFWIFLGAFLLVSVIVIIITSFAYECKLTKTIDKINKFLERNPRINDDNLVAFNNLMKASGVPKILRRQWQQFMLYREHPASYYMSFQHCVENPMRNSTYNQQMTVYKVISYILVALSLMVSVFMAVQSFNSNLVLQDIVIIPVTILVLYWLISMILNLIHSAISGDLFQNYQYFEINMDKAMLTLPEFVDYEVLFSQDEIRRGIPVLFAYLQKRAIQEQQELEKARLKSMDHEKFDFDQAGLDGSLVLDRAMRETENYTTQRKKYMQEIERVNNEIAALEHNYKEQTKEFQRQVQTSKETVENLKEQLEQATSTIEINYIKKQMRDEINRQQEAEKEFDILTDKNNQEIKTLLQEIKHYEEETKKAKEAMEVAMLSEFNTYSIKVYDNLEKIVDEKMQDRVDDYKDQIKGLEIELEEKNEELENVYTRYQEVLAQIPVEPEQMAQEVVEEVPTKKGKKKKKSSKDTPVDNGLVQPEGQYQDYNDQYEGQNYDQYDNNQPYYDQEQYGDEQQYYDNNQYENQDYVTDDGAYNYQDYITDNGQYTENYDEVNQNMDNEYVPLNDEYVQNSDYVPVDDNLVQNEEYIPAAKQETHIPLNEEYILASEQDKEHTSLNEEYIIKEEQAQQEVGDSKVTEQPHDEDETPFDDTDFDIDFNEKSNSTKDFENMDFDFDFDLNENKFTSSNEENGKDLSNAEQEDEGEFDLNKALGLYDSVSTGNKKEPEFEDIFATEDNKASSQEDSEGIKEKPRRKAGRPRKVVDETEEKPKRRVGRPKKVRDESENVEKPKRKAGRPRKVVNGDITSITPKRKAGRPRKVVNKEETSTVQKRKAGRPRKVETEVKNTPKRKAGRPRKQEIETKTNEVKAAGRRGRPKKNVEVKTTVEKTSKRGRPRKQSTNKNIVVDEQGVLGKPKRKVGRPKKTGK